MNKNNKISRLEKCRYIIKKGNPISKEDEKFLLDLIKNHPNYNKKIGCGIKRFLIKKTYWNNYGIFIERIDNSTTDFSFMKCLYKKNKLSYIKNACRMAIANDIILSKSSNNIAHHDKITFKEIFNLWIKDKNIENLEVCDTKDNCVITYFKDNKISEDFRRFHNSIAKIKEVSIEEHKKLHKKKDI